MRTLHAPVAAPPDFLGQQPIGRARERMIRRQPRFPQRIRRDARVPDHRETRLEIESAFVVHQQVEELLLGFLHVGMVLGVSQQVERHDHVHHGRIDGADAVAVARAFENPLFRAPDGLAAQAFRTVPLPELDELVGQQEKVAPPEEAFVVGEAQRHARSQQLVEREPGRHRTPWIQGVHHGQRNHDRPRPGSHLVDQTAEQHAFGGNRGRMLARVQPEEAEVHLDVTVGRLHPSHRQDALAQSREIRIAVGQPGEL